MSVELVPKAELTAIARAKFDAAVGWRYGLVFGLLVVVVGWGWDAWHLALASVDLFWPKLLLAMLTILPLSALAGYLTGRVQAPALLKILVWAGWGIAVGILSEYISFTGWSAVAGLLDPAVRGQAVFPLTSEAQFWAGATAFVGVLLAVPAALLQITTSNWAWDRSTSDNRLTPAAWAMLGLGIPLAIIFGFIYDYTANATLRTSLELTNHMVQIALYSPPGQDIRQMSQSQMLAYIAASTWRDRVSPRYDQDLADYDPQTYQSATVDTVFDNGLILRCQTSQYGTFIAGCYDLAPELKDAMAEFLRTGNAPCQDCTINVAPAAANWQSQHRGSFGGSPQIQILHHAGSIILLHASFADRNSAECRLAGVNPIEIQACVQVR